MVLQRKYFFFFNILKVLSSHSFCWSAIYHDCYCDCDYPRLIFFTVPISPSSQQNTYCKISSKLCLGGVMVLHYCIAWHGSVESWPEYSLVCMQKHYYSEVEILNKGTTGFNQNAVISHELQLFLFVTTRKLMGRCCYHCVVSYSSHHRLYI